MSDFVNASGPHVRDLARGIMALLEQPFEEGMQADLAVKKSAMENTIKTKQAAFDNKLREYQTKMDYLTPAERQKTENDLKFMQADGEKTIYDMQNKFQAEAASLNEQLLFKIEDFLKGYAKANGHTRCWALLHPASAVA